MSSEATNTPRASLTALAAAVELLEVRPRALVARVLGEILTPGTVLELKIKNELAAKQEDARHFVVSANFAIDATAGADSREDFLEIRYTIISRYRVPAGHPLEQSVLDLFAKTNGMVHLWPYLRAFVANSCAQLCLPPITLPPFRVQHRTEAPPKKPDSAAS